MLEEKVGIEPVVWFVSEAETSDNQLVRNPSKIHFRDFYLRTETHEWGGTPDMKVPGRFFSV